MQQAGTVQETPLAYPRSWYVNDRRAIGSPLLGLYETYPCVGVAFLPLTIAGKLDN